MLSVVCLDIDGTLLDNSHDIPPSVIESMVRCARNGVQFVLGSGRPLESIQEIAIPLPQIGHLIGLNGSVSLDKDNNQIACYGRLSHGFTLRLVHDALESGFAICLYTSNEWYAAGPAALIALEIGRSGVAPSKRLFSEHSISEHVARVRVLKLLVIGNPDALRKVRHSYSAHAKNRAEVYSTYPEYLEFGPIDVSKASTLGRLLKRMGKTFEDVLAIGDGENDISLASKVATFVCMSNSTENLRTASHFETDSNENGGVATALNALVLGDADALAALKSIG